MQPLLIADELVFALILVLAVRDYVRDRDPVSRALILSFAALGSLLVVQVIAFVAGSAPGPVNAVVGVLLLLQPVFVLYLTSLVREIPRRLLPAATILLIAATGGAVVTSSTLRIVFTVAFVGLFIGIEVLVAGYLMAEARRRRRPTSDRFWIAAGSTAFFALALFAGLGSSALPSVADIGKTATISLLLVSALGYYIAFLPPGPLRRAWQASVTVDFVTRLLAAAHQPVERIWADLADMAVAVNGGAALVVEVAQGSSRVVASAGMPQDSGDVEISPADFDALADASTRGPELAPAQAGEVGARLTAAVGARFISVVALPGPSPDRRTALVLLSSHRSLARRSDLDLLTALGGQTSVVAERREILADQEHMTQRLEATVEALESAGRAKSDFLSMMSHELRTPLSSIIGFSELIRDESPTEDRVVVPRDWIDHIHRGGNHLLGLVNDVLDLAKVEAGRLDLQVESIDVDPAVAEVIHGLLPLAERKGLTLAHDPSALSVLADRGRFRQVLYNLLSNAIKFTPEGGSVRLAAAAADDGQVVVSVTDTGVGIAVDDLATIFDEFRQVGSERSREGGTGLGLALTRRLVEAHGGRIGVASVLGEGTTFTASFLSAAAMTEGAVVPARSSSDALGVLATRAGPSTARPEVLVVEDDPSALRLLREYLEPSGYAVRAATDGGMALTMARERRPSAILLDVLLPTVDGWEVLRQLKDDESLADVPVIVVTVVDEREIGLALGAVDYLVKPIPRDVLLATLARYVPLTEPGTLPRTALAIDDEQASLDLIRATLEPNGWNVVATTDGKHALREARRMRPDVVICDLVMPEVDGFEIISRLKEDPATAAIPILVCTGHDLTAADKARLGGQILGVVTKGAEAREWLHHWLAGIIPLPIEQNRASA
jgi:signal transduction histidine kinase/DNA-binding response OmpR family regulator